MFGDFLNTTPTIYDIPAPMGDVWYRPESGSVSYSIRTISGFTLQAWDTAASQNIYTQYRAPSNWDLGNIGMELYATTLDNSDGGNQADFQVDLEGYGDGDAFVTTSTPSSATFSINWVATPMDVLHTARAVIPVNNLKKAGGLITFNMRRSTGDTSGSDVLVFGVRWEFGTV